MVKHQAKISDGDLDAVFSALSDPTRRAMLARLAGGTVRVTELAEPFEMSLPAVSKHLRVLERAGLVARRVEGRVHHCRLEAEPMRRAAEWINTYRNFWQARLDSLAGYLGGITAGNFTKEEAGEESPPGSEEAGGDGEGNGA